MRFDIHVYHHFVDDDHHHERRRHLRWTIGPVSEQSLSGPRQDITMLQLSDSQRCSLSITPTDKKGHAAAVDGVPVWTSSDETVGTVEASADGLSAVVTAGAPGTCQINVSADADLGSGVESIAGALDLTVVAGKAVALTIGTGTPEEV